MGDEMERGRILAGFSWCSEEVGEVEDVVDLLGCVCCVVGDAMEAQ